jgi:Plasmid stabilization system protein
MAEFFYSPEARRDLLEMWEFIAQDDLGKADCVEREIEKAITKLADNPKLGHLRFNHEANSFLDSLLLPYHLRSRHSTAGGRPDSERMSGCRDAAEIRIFG